MNKYQKELVKSYRAFGGNIKKKIAFKLFKHNYKACQFSIEDMQKVRRSYR